jgi:hypothetical protein
LVASSSPWTYLRDLVGERLLCLVEVAARSSVRIHLLDLLNRDKRQEFEAFDDVRVGDVSPILEEIKGRCLCRG